MLRVWTSDDFIGHWPVGTAAVVIAETEAIARKLLMKELQEGGLEDAEFTLKAVKLFHQRAIILCDGNY